MYRAYQIRTSLSQHILRRWFQLNCYYKSYVSIKRKTYSWTNSQPPVWMKRPESLSVLFPSPIQLYVNLMLLIFEFEIIFLISLNKIFISHSQCWELQNICYYLTCSDVLDFKFSRRKKINSGDRFIADSHKTFVCVNVNSSETIEVLEKSPVWGSEGEFNLG